MSQTSLQSKIHRGSRRRAVVILQHAAQSLAACDCSIMIGTKFLGHDQSVAETLVVSFQMVMQNEFLNYLTQRAFTKQDHLIQARFPDAADEPFGIGV